mgnify:FL=1
MRYFSFFLEYKHNSFLAFSLITFLSLLILSPLIHLDLENQLYGRQIDLRLIVMLLLAEPHFAMTIPLLYGYKDNFTDSPLSYVLIPLVIIFFGTFLFFQINTLFVIIFLIANVYHVNRQSVGFFMLQGKLPFQMKFLYEVSLHLLTSICLYVALVMQQQSIAAGIVILAIFITAILTLFKIKTGSFPAPKGIIVLLQGYLIFLPIVIFSDLLLAFAVGISVHSVSYTHLTLPTIYSV